MIETASLQRAGDMRRFQWRAAWFVFRTGSFCRVEVPPPEVLQSVSRERSSMAAVFGLAGMAN